MFLEKAFLPGLPGPCSLAGCRIPWKGVFHYLYKIILKTSNLGRRPGRQNDLHSMKISNYLAAKYAFGDPFTLITPRASVAGKSHETC